MITGWISDPVTDPEELAPGAFEFICFVCHLVAHVGGRHGDACRDCT